VSLPAGTGGTVVDVLVRVGDSTKAGQPVLEIADEDGQSHIVVAPAGHIVSATPFMKGDTVLATDAVLQLIPESARLAAEIVVPAHLVDLIESGQEVSLTFDGVKQPARGTIRSTPPDLPATVPLPEFGALKAMVELDSAELRVPGGVTRLRPGMSLKADVVLGRYSFLDWMFNPHESPGAGR
jgi:multidrug efflux pump subunit AcrA (membrane-fusion protein)